MYKMDFKVLKIINYFCLGNKRKNNYFVFVCYGFQYRLNDMEFVRQVIIGLYLVVKSIFLRTYLGNFN